MKKITPGFARILLSSPTVHLPLTRSVSLFCIGLATLQNVSGQVVPPPKDTAVKPAAAQDKVVMEEFEVKGIRESMAEALARQKESPNLKSVLTANDVGAMPDKNVADALSRIAGISVLSREGEGRFITIRGVDSGLNNVTMNGENVAASDTGGRSGRSAPLDLMSTATAGRIEVVKTITPDMDGQSIGGTINILTPSAFDWRTRQFFGTAEFSINDLYAKGSIYNSNINYADQLGAKNQWGLFLSANQSHREYSTNNLQARYTQQGTSEFTAPDRIRLPGRRGTHDRLGLTGNLEFQPGGGRKFYVRGYFTDNDNDFVEAENRIDFVGPFTNLTATTGNAVGSWANLTDYVFSERQIIQYVAGGEVPLGANFIIAGSVAYTEATESLPVSQTFDFRSPGSRPVFYNLSRPYFPGWDIGYGPNQFPTEKTVWEINRILDESSDVLERTYTARLDLSWRRELMGRNAIFKFGGKTIDRQKSVNDESHRYSYSPRPRANLATIPASFGQLGVEHAAYLGFGSYLDGRYGYGPTVNAAATSAWFNATKPQFPGFVDHQNSTWAFLLAPSFSGSSEDDYELTEKIHSAYARGDVDVTDRLKVLGGARMEWTDGRVDSVTLSTRGTFSALEPAHGGSKYTTVLPNLQFRFEPAKRWLVRGAVTWTLSRPDYVDMAPNSTLQFDDTNGNGILEGSLQIGNPDLKPYRSTNYDISVDYYLPHSGVLSFGYFRKEIKNAIYQYKDILRNVTFGTRFFESLSRDTFLNAAPGHIGGWELSYEQNFTFLPAPFDGFGMTANLVLTDSGVRSLTRSDEVTFFGQSDRIGNVQLYFQKHGFEARLGYHWQDDALALLGASRVFDSYYDARKTLDFKATYRISRHFRIYGEVRNMRNEPGRTYTDRPGLAAFDGAANEYSGVFYTLGLGWNF